MAAPSEADREQLKSDDRAALERERRLPIDSIHAQDIPRKEKTALIKAAILRTRKDEKLYRRYKTYIDATCKRCDQHVEETTRHLFLDCPATKQHLAKLRHTVLANENSRRQELGRAACGWRDLFTNITDDPAYTSDDVSAYWLVLGFIPAKASQEIECDDARRTFRAEVCAEKNIADAEAYLLARWASARADNSMG